MAQAGAISADAETVTEQQPTALNGVSERIDALEGHLAQLLARQRGSNPAAPAPRPATPASSQGAATVDENESGRIVRADLQFDADDDPDGFDERFTAFTDATEVDERSRDWLLS